MWDLPGTGIELVSPALAGGFLTTAPPGKSLPILLYLDIYGCQETKKGTKDLQNSQKTINKMATGSPYQSIITLNVNE